jgi:pimeloyl-ACP methyl ester carboxylesterase
MLAIILVLLGLSLVGLIMFVIARGILSPPRLGDGAAMWRFHRLSPGDLGLRFENQSFAARDARTGQPLVITGWWIPRASGAEPGRCALLLHRYGGAKVDSINWAPLLHQLGWNVLAIDLRAHGESGGQYSTAGYYERDDVNQVLDALIAARPAETKQLMLFGIELGAVVAAATAVAREDVAALVLDSLYDDFARAVAMRTNRLGIPFGRILNGAVRLAEWIADADFSEVRSTQLTQQIRCPMLAIEPNDVGDVAERVRAFVEQINATLNAQRSTLNAQ